MFHREAKIEGYKTREVEWKKAIYEDEAANVSSYKEKGIWGKSDSRKWSDTIGRKS